MSTTESSKNNLPEWQRLTGLTPEREKTLTDDERDAAVRVLLKEVERIAKIEFDRGENVPAGERTVLWSPLEKVCRKLEISRVKLSAYSRELTGMRAHELTDRIQAERSLRKLMNQRVQKMVLPELEQMRGTPKFARLKEARYSLNLCKSFCKWLKTIRSNTYRGRWAAEMGFANGSRASRACLLAFGTTIDDLEASMVFNLVQKFANGSEGQPQRAQSTQRNGGETENLDAQPSGADNTKAAEIIKEAVEAVMRGRVAVA